MQLWDTLAINASGTSDGATKGWDTRGRGHTELKKANKGLMKRGWLGHMRPGGMSFTHPNMPGHVIRTVNTPTGGMRWFHFDGHRIKEEQGNSSHSLLQHADSYAKLHETVKNQTGLAKILPMLYQLANNEVLRHLLDPEVLDKLDDIPEAVEGLAPYIDRLGSMLPHLAHLVHGSQEDKCN